MERVAFKVDTGEGCVCRGVITLNSMVFGNGTCTLVTCNSSQLNLMNVGRAGQLSPQNRHTSTCSQHKCIMTRSFETWVPLEE
eukprot:834574-Pelagomonas_calceolata.AAC.1